jgi:hypothetical protein
LQNNQGVNNYWYGITVEGGSQPTTKVEFADASGQFNAMELVSVLSSYPIKENN